MVSQLGKLRLGDVSKQQNRGTSSSRVTQQEAGKVLNLEPRGPSYLQPILKTPPTPAPSALSFLSSPCVHRYFWWRGPGKELWGHQLSETPASRRSHTCSRPGPRLLWAGHRVSAHKNPVPAIQTVRFREGEWPTQGRTADLARARAHKQNDWTRLLAKQHQLHLAGGWGLGALALPRNSAQHSTGGGR